MSEYDEDLNDKYESQSGGGDYAPVISWAKSDPGDGFAGILLPDDPTKRPDKGYGVRREYKQENKKENQPAGFTVWPPKNNQQKIKTPVVESQYAELWPDLDVSEAKKVEQYHYTFETGITDGTLMSRKQKERYAEAEPPKDPASETRRRIIEQGKDLTAQIAAALKKVGGKPIPGQTWKVDLSSKTPNEYGGDTNGFTVTITAPTAETKAVVAAYVEKAKLTAAQDEDDDKYTSATSEKPPFGGSAEEPPF